MLDRILVPLDGSEVSERALPYAAEIAARLGSELTLLYVADREDAEHRRVFEAYLETVARRTAEQYGGHQIRITAVVRQGNPPSVIVDYAAESHASLIVIASHGRSGAAPWAVGGTAAKVVQHLGVPTLLVRAGQAPAAGEAGKLFDRVLVPLDGSAAGEAALPYVTELAKHAAMKISLLEVIAPGQYVHTVGGLNYVRLPPELTEKMKTDAELYLEKVRATLSGTKAVAECEVRDGDAALEILKFCDEKPVSLVAMSSHGHSGIERWMLGSISHKVLHAGKTSLLLVKATAATA